MRGSPVKLAVIIAAAIVGIVVLATAFDTGTPTIPTGPAAVVSPSSSVTKSPKPPKKSPESVEGVQVGVYNGTTRSGLAAEVGIKLGKQGYVINEVGNTVDPAKTTLVYFSKPNYQAVAEQLAQTQFDGATVEQKPANLKVINDSGNVGPPSKTAQVLVLVGADYAA